MRKLVIVVFDDVVAGTPSFTTYTSQEHNDVLGMYDKIALHAVADQVSGGITAFNIDLEHSGDGRNWKVKTTGIIGSTSVSANTTSHATGGDGGSTPSCGKQRLAINSTGTGAGQYHLRITATLRDES